jgi:hypothetical protein
MKKAEELAKKKAEEEANRKAAEERKKQAEKGKIFKFYQIILFNFFIYNLAADEAAKAKEAKEEKQAKGKY